MCSSALLAACSRRFRARSSRFSSISSVRAGAGQPPPTGRGRVGDGWLRAFWRRARCLAVSSRSLISFLRSPLSSSSPFSRASNHLCSSSSSWPSRSPGRSRSGEGDRLLSSSSQARYCSRGTPSIGSSSLSTTIRGDGERGPSGITVKVGTLLVPRTCPPSLILSLSWGLAGVCSVGPASSS